jgi:TRAP transporter TAXI family solute receptor
MGGRIKTVSKLRKGGRKMKRLTSALMITMVLSLAFGSGMPTGAQASSSNPDAIAVGTAGVGGVFYVLSVSLADIISKHTKMSASAQPVGGSDANMRAIKMGKVHIAMANTFSSGNAYFGVKQFGKEGRLPVRLMALGQPSLRQLIARADAGIKAVPDLRGKRWVAKRKALAEVEMVADAMLRVYGVDKSEVKYVATARTKGALDALSSNTVDAGVLPGGVPAGFLMKLFERTDMMYVEIPRDKMEVIVKELGPAFHIGVIPKGTYKGHNKDALAPSLSASLVASKDLSTKTVYEIVKAFFDNYSDFKLSHKAARFWTVDNTLKKFHIPFHDGAIKYFKQKGVWTAGAEKKQQELLSAR